MEFKITKKYFLMLFLALNGMLSAQIITSFSPTVVTQRSVVIINGSGFTGATAVRFGGTNAASYVVNNANQITATVGSGATGNVTVVNGGTATSATTITYVTPAPTNAATSGITRIVTNFDGYWNSAAVSSNASLQPDTGHSLMSFQYGGVMYSTGSTTAATILNNNGVAFTAGNYRALPINNILGNVGSDNNLIVMGSKIDGNPNGQTATAPGIAGLSARDVLIDGIRGLDLGTGVTNLPASAVLTFTATNILSAGINDNIPDIIVSQIAEPTDGSYSIYMFIDSNGNVVGTPIQVAFNAITAVGRYKSDFFTLPVGTALNSAVVSGSTTVGGTTRDIRLVAYKLSDFGITEANKGSAAFFKVMPSGTSDPAFMAYNRDSFDIPAPVITTQPVSQVACTGVGNNVTFTVAASGSELVYQWEKNGIEIPGATNASYTITNVQTADIASYRVLVSNSAGAALSNYVYLNTIISLQPVSVSTCLNTAVILEATANGANISYQWYSNATNSNSGGTIIGGATSDNYSPPVNAVGIKYYYVRIANSGQSCAAINSNAVSVTVSAPAVAGTAIGTQTICVGNTAQLSVSGHSGSIRWQQSADGSTNWITAIDGVGVNATTYTTPALTTTTYYRARLSNGACAVVVTSPVTVSVTSNNVWTGAINNGWNTPGNWSCGYIPSLVSNVQIPVVVSNNYPIINNEDGIAHCNDLTVANGANIMISGSGAGVLQIAGSISNNGSINTSNGTIAMVGSAAQTIPSNVFASNKIRNLTINNTFGVSLGGQLDLTGILTLTAGQFATGDALTLKSNASTTAMVAPVTGSVSGNMTIERYIPARRAFRLMSSPIDGGSINANWQEGFSAATGFGTDITGIGGLENGFDVSGSNNASLFTFDNIGGTWGAITNTLTTNLTAGTPYRLLVRGDRTIDQTSNSAIPNITTLRSTGTIKTGNVSVTGLSTVAGKNNFIGNPYQAPVDMNAVMAASSNVNPNFYYMWDPTLGGTPTPGQSGGRGAYVTVLLPGGTNSSGSAANQYLQPNQAVFVQTLNDGGNTSVMFQENFKTLLTNTTPNVYRNSNEAVGRISLQLYDTNSLALNDTPADGLIVEFSDSYNNGLDAMDAKKIGNQDENCSLLNSGTLLSVERRSLPTIADILPLSNTQYRKTNYTYTIQTSGITGVSAYLHDKFTTETIELNNDTSTVYNFTVNAANAQSSNPNRFDIIFNESLGIDDIAKGNAVKVYPNPSTGSQFFVELSAGTEDASVTIHNALGQQISASTVSISGSKLVVNPQVQMAAGIYMIQVIQGNNKQTKKLIIK